MWKKKKRPLTPKQLRKFSKWCQNESISKKDDLLQQKRHAYIQMKKVVPPPIVRLRIHLVPNQKIQVMILVFILLIRTFFYISKLTHFLISSLHFSLYNY